MTAVILPEEFRTLFLGDLSIHCSRQDVLYLFHQFGNIERITLKVGTSMKGLGYGFITFTERSSAEAAMNSLQGTVLLGRGLRISWATPRGQTHLISKEPNKDKQKQTAEVHFSFLTKQTHFLVTEAIIREQYSKFGDILDVVIKRTKLNQKLSFQNGYGFVRYPLNPDGIQAAINATSFMHQVMIDGINYDTHLTHALESLLERINPEVLKEIHNERNSEASKARQAGLSQQFAMPPNGYDDDDDYMMQDDEYLSQQASFLSSSSSSLPKPRQFPLSFNYPRQSLVGQPNPYPMQMSQVPQQQQQPYFSQLPPQQQQFIPQQPFQFAQHQQPQHAFPMHLQTQSYQQQQLSPSLQPSVMQPLVQQSPPQVSLPIPAQSGSAALNFP